MRTYLSPPRGRAPRWLGCLAGLVLLVLAVQPAAAQRKYLVELGAAGQYQSFDNATDLGGAVGGLGRLGVWLPLNFSVELEGGFASPKTQTTSEGVSVKTISGSALYNILVGTSSSIYLKGGIGSTKYGSSCPSVANPGDPICGSSTGFVGGVGFRVGVTPTVMVRGQGLLVRNKSRGPNPVSLSNFGASLGVSLMLGSKPILDDDGDGVLNNRDRCPGTPSGASVDGRGCPSDGDGDGVPDGLDRCPTTVAGAVVDPRGCPQDSDGDNIPDGLDKCPDTPAGVLVDPHGCPKDSDGDHIPDGLDRCSDTPRGATVDALGCPGDEDGDGVLDGLDRCPRTPAGAAVDASGCAAGQSANRAVTPAQPRAQQPAAAQPPPTQRPAPTPAAPKPGAGQPPPKTQPDTLGRPLQRPNVRVETTSAPLTAGIIAGVAFAPGTARLQPGSYVALDSVAQILKASPQARVEIGAHVDRGAAESDNLRLTALRAEAVRDYLVVQGVAYQQVVTRGYGSSVPLTTDTTPRGRAANNRIELRPVESGP